MRTEGAFGKAVADLAAGCFVLALGVAAFVFAGSFERIVWKYPVAVSLVLAVLGLLILLQATVRLMRLKAEPREQAASVGVVEDAEAHEQRRISRFDVGVSVVLAVAFVLLLPRLGFLITTFLSVAGFTLFLARDRARSVAWRAPLIGAVMAGVLYYLFASVLNVPLHSGAWVESLLA